MVGNVSSVSYGYPAMSASTKAVASASVRYTNDVENMIKYLNGQPLTSQDDISIGETVKGTLPLIPVFGAFTAWKPLKSNNFNILKTIKDVNAASVFKTRGQAGQAAKSEFSKFLSNFKDITKKTVAVDDSRRFAMFKWLDKIPGYSKLRNSGFGQMMGKTGAGSWAVFGGAIELLTQVVPAFQQGGAASGFKQIGKSLVKVAGDTVGFVAGDAVGKAAGAAIGTAICPGIGTAIGTFVGGLLGGIVGSAVVGKATKAITGKTEVEKIQDEQTAQAAQQIDANAEQKLQLAQATLEQANAVLAQDPENKDALAAKASAEKIIAELTQQNQQAQQAQQPQQQYAQTAQQGVTMTPWGVPMVPGFNGFGYDMNVYTSSMQNTTSLPSTQQQKTFTNTVNPFMQAQA